MKKFLTVTSLVLAAMMLFSVVPASAATLNEWEAPEGVQKYYANDISGNAAAPVVDGEIADGEYGDLTARMTPDDRFSMAGESTGNQDSVIDDARADQPASDYIDFYFAYDANYIYIAIEDMGGSWEEDSPTYEFIQNLVGEEVNVGTFATRNNYHFNTGFFLDDCTSYISMQASSRGFDENKWFDQGSSMNSNQDPVYGQPTAFVNEAYIKKSYVEDGEVFADAPGGYKNNSDTDRGNVNQYKGQYKAVIELKYSKAHLINLMNELYAFDFVELPNAMWFWFVGRTYAVKDVETDDAAGSAHGGDVTGYNRYFATDIRESDVDYFDIGVPEGSSMQTIPNLIVFGDEDTELSMGRYEGDPEDGAEDTGNAGDETTEPVVETTEPVVETTEPVVDNDDEDEDEDTKKPQTTKAPETTAEVEEKGGCGGSVSVAGLALVAALGTCTVFVAKKKED